MVGGEGGGGLTVGVDGARLACFILFELSLELATIRNSIQCYAGRN